MVSGGGGGESNPLKRSGIKLKLIQNKGASVLLWYPPHSTRSRRRRIKLYPMSGRRTKEENK